MVVERKLHSGEAIASIVYQPWGMTVLLMLLVGILLPSLNILTFPFFLASFPGSASNEGGTWE